MMKLCSILFTFIWLYANIYGLATLVNIFWGLNIMCFGCVIALLFDLYFAFNYVLFAINKVSDDND